ncbi:MAG: hypothetical protein GXN92_00795 [Candidatus Micrarchaeota archaeon]|nr:hypothetical protein [Candidatus Micrarchaeota archaeon]
MLEQVLLFLAGYLGKRIVNLGDLIAKALYYVIVPALILHEVPGHEINTQIPYFILPFVVSLPLVALVYFWKKDPLWIMGVGMINSGFVLPFYLEKYPSPPMLSAILGTMALHYIVIYGLVVGKDGWKKVLSQPILWAYVIALLNPALPAWLDNVLAIIGSLTGPLTMVMLGMFFEFRLGKEMASVLALRMIGGLLLGWAYGSLMGFDQAGMALARALGGAPTGYTSLIYASLLKLDTEKMAQAVSLGTLLGFLWVPLWL